MQLLIFFFILSFLIFIHELGHFVMARRAGVKVEEFGFGYPPMAWKFYTDAQGTDYTINWLPFGGFVRMHGEDDEVQMEESRAFYTKKKGQKLGILVAGAVMNFLFGVVAFGAIYTKTGIPAQVDYVLIEEIASNSPADESRLILGDRVTGIVVDGEPVKISGVESFKENIAVYRGSSVNFSVEREGEMEEIPVYVRTDEELPENEGSIGVVISDVDYVFYPSWQMPFRGVWLGLKTALNFGIFLLGMLGGMFRDLFFSGKVPADVAGPVGIGHQVVQQSLLTVDLISVQNFTFAAIISINLAIMNLLPIPALDGGRVFFVLLEGMVKKERLEKIERKANTYGFVLLLGMIFLVSIRDVKRIVVETGVLEWISGMF